jgi:pyruvate,water dikinase
VRLLEEGAPGRSYAVRSSANGEDSAFSFAGQYKSVLDVQGDNVPAAWREVLAGFFNPGAVTIRLRRGFAALELGMAALAMPMVEAKISGVAYSKDPTFAGESRVRIEAVPGACSKLVEGGATPEVSWVNPQGWEVLRDGGGSLRPAILEEGLLVRIASLAKEAEAVLQSPADVEWAVDSSSVLWLIQARPAAFRLEPADSMPPRPGRVILAQDGVRASAGAGYGPVLHVMDAESAAGAPRGFVIVAPEASPELALLLPRAAAVVTERGGALSHLAAVAREFEVPALFGVASARKRLLEGKPVTVDATAGLVYEGKVEEVLLRDSPITQLPENANPIQKVVRDLIPHVTPLRLLDPHSPHFRPEKCQSVHDVVRFIHEEALAAMARLGESLGGQGGKWGLKVQEKMPVDLWVIPLGSGAIVPKSGSSIPLKDITSPLAMALFSGLADPEVSREGSGPIDAMGFLSVVSNSMVSGGELGAPCWALISDRYLHMSSRIGYHFATVEALFGKRDAENRIHFLFKGGAANSARKELRAGFLATVLAGLGFKVKHRSDLVSATCSEATQAEMVDLLRQLGRLLVCSSRLDMLLVDAKQAALYSQAFLEGRYSVILRGEHPPDTGH